MVISPNTVPSIWSLDHTHGSWTEFDDHQPNPKEENQILALKGGGDHHMGYLLMYKALYI
jgi:hypothetical protein